MVWITFFYAGIFVYKLTYLRSVSPSEGDPYPNAYGNINLNSDRNTHSNPHDNAIPHPNKHADRNTHRNTNAYQKTKEEEKEKYCSIFISR
jgi:hypothetical protein